MSTDLKRRLSALLAQIDAKLEENEHGEIKFAKSQYEEKARIEFGYSEKDVESDDETSRQNWIPRPFPNSLEFYSEAGRECLRHGKEWRQDRCQFYHVIHEWRYRLFSSLEVLYMWLERVIELQPYQRVAQIRADMEQEPVFVVRSRCGICVHTHAEIMEIHLSENLAYEYAALPRKEAA